MGFYKKVYDVVRQIPYGKVATYGQIAAKCGSPRSSRIVGWVLHVNPDPDTIPCHRVVNRFGHLSGGFAFGGIDIQKNLLACEGVFADENYTVDLSRYLWKD